MVPHVRQLPSDHDLLYVSLATYPVNGAIRGMVPIATNADQLNIEYRNPPERPTAKRIDQIR